MIYKDDKQDAGPAVSDDVSDSGKDDPEKAGIVAEVQPVAADQALGADQAAEHAELKRVFRRAAWYSLALTLIVAILGASLPASPILERVMMVECGADGGRGQCPFRCSSRTTYSASRSTPSGWRARCASKPPLCRALLTVSLLMLYCSIWVAMSGTFCIVLPIVESRREIIVILGGVCRALRRGPAA